MIDIDLSDVVESKKIELNDIFKMTIDVDEEFLSCEVTMYKCDDGFEGIEGEVRYVKFVAEFENKYLGFNFHKYYKYSGDKTSHSFIELQRLFSAFCSERKFESMVYESDLWITEGY